MGWKCVYSSCVLTFYLFGRTLSFPQVNSLPCEALSRLYPSSSDIGEISAGCLKQKFNPVPQKLDLVFVEYCDELYRLQEEICGKNFTDFLNSIPPDISSAVIHVPFVEATTNSYYHCEDFNSLNKTLYKFYLDKPGFGKRLSEKIFCTLFCKSYYVECETLLRTYWIMKVLQDYKEKAHAAKGKNDHNMIKENAQHEKRKIDNDENAQGATRKKDAPGQASTSVPVTGHNGENSKEPKKNLVSKDEVTNEKNPVSKDEVTEIKAKGISTPLGGGKSSETNIEPTEPTSTKMNKKDDNNNSEKHSNKKGNLPVSTGKPKEDKSDDKHSTKKQEEEEKTKNDKDIKDSKLTEKPKDIDVKGDKTQTKEITKGRETTPILVTEPKDDGKQENDKVEVVVPQVPDKIPEDVATTAEADTEFGNQIHDIGDGFGEQDNEYPPEEPDIHVPDIETPQSGSLDENNNDKKTQQDGTTVEKQPADVPQLPAFPEEEDGHFFAYFLAIIVLCIAGYLVFHNKQKIIALIVEGRHERRRRPNNGTYKRLDNKDGATSHVIF